MVRVQDPLTAFQDLAGYHRRRFAIPVIAVTGSNGKTTTKEMVAKVLQEKWRVLSTKGNFNNSIGLPHTLLRLHAGHQAAVIEMGVDQEGQTTRLCQISSPTIGVITNIGPDHLEYFGSLERSARSKAELLACLPHEGTIVLNADDPYFPWLKKQATCSVVSFGFSAKATVRGIQVESRERSTTFRVPLPSINRIKSFKVGTHGRHNIANALAALAVGHALGMPFVNMAKGLVQFRPADMRSQVWKKHGITVIYDCYNANPASMKAAIDLLEELGRGARTIAVLGDMLELGQDAIRLHQEVGVYLVQHHVSCLVACGNLGKEFATGAKSVGLANVQIFQPPKVERAVDIIKNILRPQDVMLVKASRGMQLERVLQSLSLLPFRRQARTGNSLFKGSTA